MTRKLYLLALSAICTFCLLSGCRSEAPSVSITTQLPIAEVDLDTLSDSEADYRADNAFRQVAASESMELEIEEKLSRLGEYFAKSLRGVSPDVPDFVSPAFVGEGVDREKIRPRYTDDQITIGRWQASTSSPKFVGASALTAFTQNVLGNWKQANQFGIEFKIYQAESGNESVVARIVAETFGQTEKQRGAQATSLWETRWVLAEGEDLQLQSLKVLGREETIVKVDGGQLLQDCSDSILGSCDEWKNQLKFGLDQWSRQIPGLNIAGNEGVAVADINGDGLDDLYVCQGHGLANLMLMQNPDGTVRNMAAVAGVDLLDETRSALILDLDNDGDQDLALAIDDCVALYSNNGNESFQLERKLAIGYDGASLSAADFDVDGDLDLLVCKYRNVRDVPDFLHVPESLVDGQSGGRNVLLRNDEGWIFTDATEESGLTESNFGHSRSATWIDFDLDGDQDLFVANEWSTPRLYRNQNGWFTDVTDKAKLNLPSQARSVSVGDFNRDSKPDLFVANEASSRQYRVIKTKQSNNEIESTVAASLLAQSHVWFSKTKKSRRDKEDIAGTFLGYPLPSPVFTTESSFGSAVVDINNDGLEDILVANGYLSRTSSDDLQAFWANCIADDLKIDGSVDVAPLKRRAQEVSDLVRSGFSISGNQRNRCYLNMGSIGFANFSACSGIDLLNDARAIATTDWDCDGDIDVVMTSRTGPRIRILCNQMQSKNDSIGLKLKGTSCNRDAIGARVEIWTSEKNTPFVRWIGAESGYLAQSSRNLRVGLGEKATIRKVVVVWPGGKRQLFDELQANRSYCLTEDTVEAAEESNNRFDLKIESQAIANSLNAPSATRSIFFPTSVLPRINVETDKGVRYRIQSSHDEALLAVFHNGGQESIAALSSLSENAMDFSSVGIGCVAAFCDRADNDGSIEERIDLSNSAVGMSSWPWPAGIVSSLDRTKLRLACGEWFNHQHLPRFPFAILLDRTGAVKAFYPSEVLSGSTVLNDRMLFDRGYGTDWKSLTKTNGIWINTNRTANLSRLKDRLLGLGLEEEARHINRNTAASIAFQLTMRGIELSSQNELEQAGVFLERAITVHPGCVPAHIHQGNLNRKIAARLPKDNPVRPTYLDAAAESFVRALDIEPDNEEAAIGYAEANVDQLEVLKAIEKLLEFVELNPDAPRAHAILGRLFFSRKKYIDAAKHLTVAFDAHPTLPYVSGDLGVLYLGSGDLNRATKFLRLANRLQPGDRNILKHLAEAEFATGDHESAINLFESFLAGAPNHLRSNCVLAWMRSTSPYAGLRDAEEALKQIGPMVEIYGTDSAFIKEVAAACHAEKGDFLIAKALQEEASQMVKNETTTDIYSESQLSGMKERLKLYESGLPYRTKDISRIPIKQVGIGIKAQ